MVRPKSTLAVLREQQGLTQMEMATRLGASQGELSYIETGAKTPSESMARALEKEFPEISLDLLLGPYTDYVKNTVQAEGER
jgi:transcriptional regulator with XRE-family HTH domain